MPENLVVILLLDGLILATWSMDRGKCGYLGCISGWSGALMGPLGSQMVNFGHQDTNWLGGNDTEVLDEILLQDGLILAWTKENVVILGAFLVGLRPPKVAPRVTDG